MFKFSCLIMAAGAFADVSSDSNALVLGVADLRAQINAARAGDTAAMVKIVAMSNNLAESIGKVDNMVNDIASAGSEMQGISKEALNKIAMNDEESEAALMAAKNRVQAFVNQQIADIVAETKAQIATIEEANAVAQETATGPIEVLEVQGAEVMAAIQTTHYVDKTTPVYRWNWWNTYQNQYVGWYDGNNPRSFGGGHPSQWGDGNYRADQMPVEMKYLSKLFNRPGYGDKDWGTTVCADTREIPHSTDDGRCGALFRIKNIATSTIAWKMGVTFTGWSGWGAQATCACNKKNIWSSSCHGNCNLDLTMPILANSAKNRVSTVVCVAGNAHPYGHYNHHKATYLMFNNLKLPTNLEFADDMSSLASNARWD